MNTIVKMKGMWVFITQLGDEDDMRYDAFSHISYESLRIIAIEGEFVRLNYLPHLVMLLILVERV